MLRLSLALLALLPALATAQTYTLQNATVDESSGLAVSLRDPRILWTHNDSGGLPAIYRVGPEGEDLGRVDIPRAMNLDWEDIAAFRDHGRPALLIGDIGDNFARRDDVTLYAVADPGLDARTELLWRLDFRYEDGPRDAEALAVDPARREILIISKRDRPPAVYRLPLPEAPPTQPAVARRIGTLPRIPKPTREDFLRAPRSYAYLDMPTALDISRDGRYAVVVTPKDAYGYTRGPKESWAAAFARKPRTIPLPRLPQIEGGALSADRHTLFVASELGPPNFARVRLPAD